MLYISTDDEFFLDLLDDLCNKKTQPVMHFGGLNLKIHVLELMF